MILLYPIMLVCYTLLHYLVLLLTFDIGKTIWTSSFLISSLCRSREFLVRLLLLLMKSCSIKLGSMCWYLTCQTSRPPSHVSLWKQKWWPGEIIIITGNIYLGTLNTVEPVEKFIRSERIVDSFEVWQCESEYNWAGRHQILIIDLHLNSAGTAELALIS